MSLDNQKNLIMLVEHSAKNFIYYLVMDGSKVKEIQKFGGDIAYNPKSFLAVNTDAGDWPVMTSGSDIFMYGQ
jgi:hypothetical protein